MTSSCKNQEGFVEAMAFVVEMRMGQDLREQK